MTIKNQGPVVLITGASGGIGAALSKTLVANDYRVVAVGRDRQKLEMLDADCGSNLLPLVLDVNDADAVAQLPGLIPAELGPVEILVNNAGHDVGGRRRFDEGSAEQWCDIVETNVQGLIRVTRALIEPMLERGRGHIVNIGSIAGLKPYATGSAYVSSKFAVHGLSETLRLDYAGRGIRVSEIMPGLVRTGFAEQRLGDAAAAAGFYDSFEACLQPQDIAEAVLFALRQPRHVEIAQLVVLPVS